MYTLPYTCTVYCYKPVTTMLHICTVYNMQFARYKPVTTMLHIYMYYICTTCSLLAISQWRSRRPGLGSATAGQRWRPLKLDRADLQWVPSILLSYNLHNWRERSKPTLSPELLCMSSSLGTVLDTIMLYVILNPVKKIHIRVRSPKMSLHW